jgi:hypothetical protein
MEVKQFLATKSRPKQNHHQIDRSFLGVVMSVIRKFNSAVKKWRHAAVIGRIP